MAYLDLTQFGGHAVAAPAELEVASAVLTPLEWQVVGIARRDRLASLQAPGRWARFVQIFFGGDRASPRLADTRLEALRRLVVLASHKGSALPAEEIAAFHAAGYTQAQLALVLARLGDAAAR
ncbi:hypothetical protein [Sphingomonas elodea]|uniref:hypothetical protein n=1 Tax=Sphingomonas elodea TaxID=179878 RepID=UPI0002630537|nr:hypothetical protein [Sphingomonas elodea]